jgi:NTE family protein
MADTGAPTVEGFAHPYRLFVAFEGGGAKALVHVGALKAIEARGFEFKGVAGTSAGAIVAALKAAGYSADEIINPIAQHTILDSYNEGSVRPASAIDILGRSAWTRIKLVRFLSEKSNRQLTWFWCVIILMAVFLRVSLPASFHQGFVTVIWICAVSGILAWGAWTIFVRRAGLTSARSFRSALNKMLCKKLLGPDAPERDVLMADLNDGAHPCLRIVAADISSRQLRLFSSDAESDQALAIADIVTASMCIPFVFRPWRVGNKLHVDGGIVSNLPAWPFDEERELDFDAITIACEIDERARHPPDDGLDSWFRNLVHTALFGSSILNKRGVQRLEIISLPTTVGLLDFDIPRERIFEVVREATAAAEAYIIRQLVERPLLYQRACMQLRAIVRPLLANIPDALAEPNNIGRSRVAVAFPRPGFPRSLWLAYSAGFDNDADEGILLPKEGTVIGDAWNEHVCRILTPPIDPLPGPGLRRLNKLFAKDIVWIFAVPIFLEDDDDNPVFIVAIDGSDPLRDTGEVLDRIIAVLSEEAEAIFSPLAAYLERRA